MPGARSWRSFEELAAIIEAADGSDRLGVCLDSCHLLASGYDVRSTEGLSDTLDRFDEIVGLGRLGALHLNDSVNPLGSNRDRHADIGDGELGERGCGAFLSEPRFDTLPCVLETPGPDKQGPTTAEIAHCHTLRERGLRARGGRRPREGGTRMSSGAGPKVTATGDALVVFGITGDLAKLMTLNSLYRLDCRGLLNVPVIGVAVD